MHMLLQHKASQNKEHDHHKPAVFFIKSHHKWHKYNNKDFQTQKPPGIDHHLSTEKMTHTKEIHYNTDQVLP